jgi:hypothetical protein
MSDQNFQMPKPSPYLMDKIMTPVAAGANGFASGVLNAAAGLADMASFGNFPKEWSNAMRGEAKNAAQAQTKLAQTPESQSPYGKTARFGYELLPSFLIPGAGGLAFQSSLAAGEAQANNESVPVAITQEMLERLVRPFSGKMLNELTGEVLNSEALQNGK